jgi:hypothetical protein
VLEALSDAGGNEGRQSIALLANIEFPAEVDH